MLESKRGFSLAAKLTVSFVFLIVCVSVLAFVLPHGETRKTLLELTRHQLSGTAATVAVNIDGDALKTLKPGQEKEHSYIEMRDYLKRVREANSDIKYIYTYRQDGGGKLEFVADADFGMKADAAKIGEKYTEKIKEMEQGLSSPSADSEFNSDKWGVFLSGYAPVRDSKGVITGAVGVDMESTKVIERQNYIGLKIYILIGISVLIAGAIVAIFSLTIIRDIKKLNNAAELVSTGRIESDVDVKRGDEIGDLAESFQRMIVSLRIVKMYPDEKGKQK